MGLELWYSNITGITRKGTTFSELQDIFINNITTKFICEPLACCESHDSAQEVKNLMKERDFDVLGVKKANNPIGYILRHDLENGSVEKYIQPFDTNNIISDSTPIVELLNLLSNQGYIFVLNKNQISGIVAKADINKPIVRIYLFGIISLFELHLNYWIIKYYGTSDWQNQIAKDRVKTALGHYKERQDQNLDLTLLECLQLCDKRDILKQTDEFLILFNYSKTKFKDLLKDVEKVRNDIAHSHSSVIANLSWDSFTSTIDSVKAFLAQSEQEKINKAHLP
ncbi:MAG: CBS domain-containing protein [Bacteroidetes bacterium]|nr:CBS domain-containing protein [Bacteroidota bacterium]